MHQYCCSFECWKICFDPHQAIHAELSKLVQRQSGNDAQQWKAKPAAMLGDGITPFLIPSKKKPSVSHLWQQLQSFFSPSTDKIQMVLCILGNFLEVHPGSSAGGSGQLSDVADSDCKELKTLHRKETPSRHTGPGRSPNPSGLHLGTENSSTWSLYSSLWEFQQNVDRRVEWNPKSMKPARVSESCFLSSFYLGDF